MTQPASTSFLVELKRRKVGRVGIAYGGASWALLDLAERTLLLFGISESLFRNLVIVAVAGLPVVLVLAWLFDLTSKGIERTPEAIGSGDAAGLSRRFTRQLVVAGALVMLVMTAVGWRYLPGDSPRLESDQIAVLPFGNQTGDPALDDLGLIVADHIMEGLGYVEAFKAIAASLPAPGTDQATDGEAGDGQPTVVRAVAERNHSALVVTGSFFRSGDDVTFRARVHDAERGEEAFSTEPFRVDPNDPMADLGRLRESLLGYFGMLGSRSVESAAAQPRRLVGGRAPSYAAYKEYAVGVRAFRAARYQSAAEQFELAASLDSTFYLALWQASTARLNIGDWAGVDRLVKLMESMRAELAPVQHVGLDWTRGQVEGDLRATQEAAVLSIDLIPTSPIVYLAAIATNAVDRPEEAIEYFSKYDLELGGGWPWVWTSFAAARHRLGQHRREMWLTRAGRRVLPEHPNVLAAELTALAARGRAKEVLERIGELDPNHLLVLDVAHELEAHGEAVRARILFERVLTRLDELSPEEQEMFASPLLRVRALAALGRTDEARDHVAALVERAPEDARYRSWSGVLAARSGDTEHAEQILTWLSALDVPYQRGSNILAQARVAAALGDTDRTIRLLDAAFEQGSSDFYNLHVDPRYSAVRDDPVFRAYMEPRG